MRTRPAAAPFLLAALALAATPAGAGRPRPPGSHEAAGFQLQASPQVNPIVACQDIPFAFVASTTSGRVDVINILTSTPAWAGKVDVGLEPVSLAARADGSGGCGGELWVSNHLSDSISVVDIEPTSASFLQVVDTIQVFDPATRATRLDEPVGIAFAEDGSKAFVALSSRNQIAVIDASTHAVSFLAVNGQEPRALAVRNGRLFVAAFESDNRTELSSCPTANPPATSPQCTVDIADILQFAMNPNLPGLEVNIVVDPDRPDRDLFVYRVSDGALLDTVQGVGTLLYGLAVRADGTVFVTQNDARNAVNGADDGFLEDLQNRMFDNQITRIDCSGPDGNPCTTVTRIPLDPALPAQPAPGEELATPYGIALSQDGAILVATAAASSRLFSLDTASGDVKARVDVGAIPRGVAFVSVGATGAAYVLNTLDNSVTRVAVGLDGALTAGAPVAVGADPTPDAVRRGRIAFESAFASDSGTFSCASCHPDAALGRRARRPVRRPERRRHRRHGLLARRRRRRPRLLRRHRRGEPGRRDVRPGRRLPAGRQPAHAAGARRHGPLPGRARLPAGALAAPERPGHGVGAPGLQGLLHGPGRPARIRGLDLRRQRRRLPRAAARHRHQLAARGPLRRPHDARHDRPLHPLSPTASPRARRWSRGRARSDGRRRWR
jgi:DNA-binding beta-propeller fold protein YncE